jgi:hypothetical protein
MSTERRDRPMAPRVAAGLYRNHAGAELRVTGAARPGTGWPTLAADIAMAESVYDDADLGHHQVSVYLVTEASLRQCGYVLVSGQLAIDWAPTVEPEPCQCAAVYPDGRMHTPGCREASWLAVEGESR